MTTERVNGLAETFTMFGALPQAARDEMGVELGIIGYELRSAQRQSAPEDTGALRSGIAVLLLLDQLRVRVGLLGLKPGRSTLYYGRFVQYGRRGQTVLVQRRRRVNGRLRVQRGRKRAEDIAATYSLKVKARAPHPYVQAASDPLVGNMVADRLAEFWSKTMQRAGATG